jgi:hypothetical protein
LDVIRMGRGEGEKIERGFLGKKKKVTKKKK